MKLTVERKPESVVMLDITADEEEFTKAVDRAFRKAARDIALPGFRKGKAPRGMVERVYGREVFVREAVDDVMEGLYRQALEQEELIPVGDPEVEINELEPVSFTVTVPVYPTVDPGPYPDVRVESVDAAIDEAAVDEVIERLRTKQSPWVDPAEPRHPREGDQITLDLATKEGDEPFQDPVEDAIFVLGESNLLAGVEEQVKGLQVGESATFDLTFADDDEMVNPTMRGKTLTYTVTLKGLKERDLLPLDDDFAQTVGDTETLDELRRRVREDLHQGKTGESRTTVVNDIIDKMVTRATIEPPEVMVNEEVDQTVRALRQRLAQSGTSLEEYLRTRDQTEEQLREEVRPDSERRLLRSILLREIADREGVEVSDEDLNSEIADLSRPASEGEETAARLANFYQSDYFRRVLRNDLFDRRLTDRLIEIATEGRGAVLNGWEPAEGTEDKGQRIEEAEAETAAVPVSDVAAEPDAAQAAAVGHEDEDVAVAAEQTAEEERTGA